MTAAEAKAISDKALNHRSGDEYAKTITYIAEQAENGKCECFVNSLSPKIQHILRQDGYRVDYLHDPRPGESCYKIDWS